MGAESPLARLDTLHLSRIQIFDQLVAPGPASTTLDHLESNYLVFTSSFDGDLDAYLDLICERIPHRGRRLVEPLRRLPGHRGPRRVQDAGSRSTSATRTCSPRPTRRATVADVRESLALRDQLVDFAADAQGLDAAALKERFLSTFAKAGR